MRCESPILAERLLDGVKIYGRFEDFQSVFSAYKLRDWLLFPCGQCLSCRMRHARDWIIRCKDELKMHDESCFVTLTYNDSHLPEDRSLCKEDYQKFFKRLRKALGDKKIRYFGCGEYGRENLRPHYHFIIFGWAPSDAYPWSFSGRAVCSRSSLLDKLWPLGFCTVGDVTDDSIAYVCRYSLKKLDLDTSSRRVQPFTVVSSRPGLGLSFFEKYWHELVARAKSGDILRYGHFYNSGFVVPPRYYTKRFTSEDDLFGLRVPLVSYLSDFARNNRPGIDELERVKNYNRFRADVHRRVCSKDILSDGGDS